MIIEHSSLPSFQVQWLNSDVTRYTLHEDRLEQLIEWAISLGFKNYKIWGMRNKKDLWNKLKNKEAAEEWLGLYSIYVW